MAATITVNAARTRLRHGRGEVSLEDLPGPHGTIGAGRFATDSLSDLQGSVLLLRALQ